MDSKARGCEVGMSGNTLILVKHSTVKGSNEWMTEIGALLRKGESKGESRTGF